MLVHYHARTRLRSAADCRSREAKAPETLDFCPRCRRLRAMSGTEVARARFSELARIVGGDVAHPALPELLDSARRGGCRSGLQAWAQRAGTALRNLPAQQLLPVCEALAALALLEEAVSLTQHAVCAREPQVAARCGAWAMQLGRHEQALLASEHALRGLLQAGLEPDEFLRLVVRGASPEGLLRYERDTVAQRAQLREPIALRWEAARKLGRTYDANLMRLLCLRYFPERASVWATAGNQSLDENDVEAAAGYFRCCLRLDPDWTAGLAGMAIVLERQKDWQAALPYRKRVMEVEHALEHAEPASLHRVLRYAAALGRLERWDEAEPLFRHCAAHGAYEKLPMERPVLARVFSHALYAPALITAFYRDTAPADAPAPELQIALHEASLLEALFRAITAHTRQAFLLRGMGAWLWGDMTRASALLEEAERESPDDCVVQYLQLKAARALGVPVRSGLEALARAALARNVDEEQALYARLILEQVGDASLSAELPEGPLGLRAMAEQAEAQPLTLGPGSLAQGLRQLTAFRSLQRQRGVPPLTTAALSLHALNELALRPR